MIKDLFLSLTRYTYPHGCEKMLEDFLPDGCKKDSFGNYYIKIGNSRTMFTCHLDTACSKFRKVNHDIYRNYIRTDGSSILGADDKAGMVVLINMIRNDIPGLYYFFIGEEVGCLGSRAAAFGDFSGYDRCISFDRRGYNSVITDQIWGTCCSDDFAKELASQLNVSGLKYRPDKTGIVTDSASFMHKIPECTNISVGYFNEHTTSEYQDINFLIKLCESVLSVSWELLPTKRDFDSHCEDLFGDTEFSEIDPDDISAEITVIIDGDSYLVKLIKDRILEERRLIYQWVFKTGCYHGFTGIDWDGKSCHITYGNNNRSFLGNRTDMIYLIDDLSRIPVSDLILVRKLTK